MNGDGSDNNRQRSLYQSQFVFTELKMDRSVLGHLLMLGNSQRCRVCVCVLLNVGQGVGVG